MKKLLVIGRHEDIMNAVLNKLQAAGYDAFGTLTNKEAERLFAQIKFDAVVIGGGIDPVSRESLSDKFSEQRPEIRILSAHPNTLLEDLRLIFTT